MIFSREWLEIADLLLENDLQLSGRAESAAVTEGETKMKMEEFKSASDSVSLAKLENKPFTVTAVEDSNYEDNGQVSQGIKLTTKETFTIDGTKYNKFHSTRTAIVNKLRDPKIRNRLAKGETLGPIKTEQVKSKKGGKPYYDLIDA